MKPEQEQPPDAVRKGPMKAARKSMKAKRSPVEPGPGADSLQLRGTGGFGKSRGRKKNGGSRSSSAQKGSSGSSRSNSRQASPVLDEPVHGLRGGTALNVNAQQFIPTIFGPTSIFSGGAAKWGKGAAFLPGKLGKGTPLSVRIDDLVASEEAAAAGGSTSVGGGVTSSTGDGGSDVGKSVPKGGAARPAWAIAKGLKGLPKTGLTPNPGGAVGKGAAGPGDLGARKGGLFKGSFKGPAAGTMGPAGTMEFPTIAGTMAVPTTPTFPSMAMPTSTPTDHFSTGVTTTPTTTTSMLTLASAASREVVTPGDAVPNKPTGPKLDTSAMADLIMGGPSSSNSKSSVSGMADLIMGGPPSSNSSAGGGPPSSTGAQRERPAEGGGTTTIPPPATTASLPPGIAESLPLESLKSAADTTCSTEIIDTGTVCDEDPTPGSLCSEHVGGTGATSGAFHASASSSARNSVVVSGNTTTAEAAAVAERVGLFGYDPLTAGKPIFVFNPNKAQMIQTQLIQNPSGKPGEVTTSGERKSGEVASSSASSAARPKTGVGDMIHIELGILTDQVY